MIKIAFLDRDGTIIHEPTDTGQIDTLERLKILPGASLGMKQLLNQGYKLVMVTNQDGLGTRSFPKAQFDKPHQKLLKVLKQQGIEFYKVFVCPHFEQQNCTCRKPKTGMLVEFLKKEKIDFTRSFVLGDRATDVRLGENLGIQSFKMMTNAPFPRLAFSERKTKETNILVQCNLDGIGHSKINSGLNFFNHMLEQLSKHSLIDLHVEASGDLHVDEHHTVEDVALVLGEALAKGLGTRRGIGRFGFLVPLDDTLAEVAVDLGGRPYLVFNCNFKRDKVGDLPTELVEHFFRSLADSLKANIHVNVKYSRNEHHKVEAIFKAFAKSLRMACEKDKRAADAIPSTKGTL